MPTPTRHFGWRPSAPDQRDYLYAAPQPVLQSLPPKFSLFAPDPGAPFSPRFDQGALGSCGPNSAAGNLALLGAKLIGKTFPMPSRLAIYYWTRLLMGTVGYDSGVDNRSMLKALAAYGWPDEKLHPYDVSKFKQKPSAEAAAQAATRRISKYLAVPQDVNTIKARIAEGHPVIFGFTVYGSMMTDEVDRTGDVPMPGPAEAVQGGHDVLLGGWDDETQRFELANSWGAGWGRNGLGSIPYGYATNPKLSGDFWTIEAPGFSPPPPPPPPAPAGATVTFPQAVPAGTYRLADLAAGVAVAADGPAPRRPSSRKRRATR